MKNYYSIRGLFAFLTFLLLSGQVHAAAVSDFPIVLEAESAQLFGDLKVKPQGGGSVSGLSGGRYIGDFQLAANSYLRFDEVEIPEEGTYELRIFSMGGNRPMSIKVNQYEKTIVRTLDSPSWDDAPAAMVSTLIYMDKGKNRITFGTVDDNGPNLDKFEIRRTSQTIPRPEIVKLSFLSDFTDNAELIAQHDNETLSALTDNDEFTIYKVPGVNQTQITVVCEYPILLTGYLLSAGIESSENVRQWALEWSEDNIRWRPVIPTKSTDLFGAYLFEINRSLVTASNLCAKYYRLTAKGTTDVEIAEWQLFGVPYLDNTDGKNFPIDITEVLDISQSVTALPVGEGGREFYNLFDRSLSNKYAMSDTKQYYVEVELSKKYVIDSYTLTSANDSPDQDPKRWTFNAYNDETGWVELDRHTEFVFPSRYASMTFNIDNKGGYTRLLLSVEDNNGHKDSQLLKWQIFGKEYDPESSIENVVNENFSIWSTQGRLGINSNGNKNMSYKVFNLSGTLQATGTLATAKEISLPRGAYVVMLNDGDENYASKVIVQ